MNDTLKDNYLDKLVALTKGITGAIPMAGSIVSEIVGNIIPNQRIDRIAKYIKVLDEKLSTIPIDRLNTLLQNTELVDLLEDGFFQASRASSDERREYISYIIINGIDGSEINYNDSRALLRLLGEITDIEVIWLRYYGNHYAKDFNTFWHLHKEVLSSVQPYGGTDDKKHREEVLQSYCSQHLERLGLIKIERPLTTRSEQMLYGQYRAELSPKGYGITRLGLTMLKQLGLLNSISQRHLNTLSNQ